MPLISQMAPSADVLAESKIDVDISAIAVGQAIKAVFRKQPVFIRNLTPAEIAEADAVPVASLRDPQTLDQRTKPGHKNWLITMGVCTHLGCVPLGTGQGEPKGEFGGYFCPCHGQPIRHRRAHPQRPRAQEPCKCQTMNSIRHSREDRLRNQTMSFPWAKQYKPNHPFMVWMDEKLPLPRFVYNSVGAGYSVPRNLNYFWNFGVLAGFCLVMQIVTGIVLAMHYAANADIAFDSTEHIMRDVNWGWLLRYMHANGAARSSWWSICISSAGSSSAATRRRAK